MAESHGVKKSSEGELGGILPSGKDLAVLGERRTEALIQRSDSRFGPAPVLVATCLPPLNTIKVGMDRMPSCCAVFGFSSR